MNEPTTIHCTESLRRLWPDPLAALWKQQYPNTFDDDDLRITPKQPHLHFCEWFAAIHLFHRDGAHSLVEKYIYANHPAKGTQLLRTVGEARLGILNDICEKLHVQPPDLFVFMPDAPRFWLAEVKGPHDSLSDAQIQSHVVIARELKVPVEVILVKIEA